MSGNKIWKRVWNALASATITQINDTGPVMLAQVKLGYLETNDNVPVVQQFGFASVPPLQSDAVASFVGGDRSNGVVVATNNQPLRFRGKAVGESVIYDAFGKSIYLTATGGIIVDANGADVTINGAADVIMNASASVTLNTPVVVVQNNLVVGTGATGAFPTGAGATVTVQDGIITNID
jgi:phage baseplate assembly protein V